MLVIMEYTSDYFRPTLQTLFSHLRPFLHDSVPAVRRKAALFFSETADYCSDIFSEAAPFLPEELQQLLNGDEFEVISALYILESFPSLYNSMSSQDVIQFVVWILLCSLFRCLLLVSCRRLHSPKLSRLLSLVLLLQSVLWASRSNPFS